jgi:hypothetical protein
MPYFRCKRCALRLYSAASETHCSECSAPLGRAERSLEPTPLARPRRDGRSISSEPPLPAGGRSFP